MGPRSRPRRGRLGGMRVKDAVGRFGEQLAAAHLSDAGLSILERNWRCRTASSTSWRATARCSFSSR